MALVRICFNFLDRCNMACPYCYCPFQTKPVTLTQCLSIVDRCVEIGAKIITFGGGDPFLFDGFPDLLKHAAQKNIHIHVDTNGLKLAAKHYALLCDTTQLLGLPLDGPTAQIHGLMRATPDHHFHIVLKHLREISRSSLRIKVNTMVSSLNKQHMDELGLMLASYQLDIWSLYQFWPFTGITKLNDRHLLPTTEFEQLLVELRMREHSFRLEAGPIEERRGTYFFVAHTGLVYVDEPGDSGEYRFLGSVFDDSTVDTWLQLTGSSIRPVARKRYSDRDSR
jgi:MoaA/NifB/PqqE/SkfB family radical SAM enzyme